MVYYRKYRPQTVSELDLEEVREKLTSILSAKELPHAFLFTGPKGLGKTSAARILAKAINCEQNQEVRVKKQGKKEKQTHDSKFRIQDSGIEPCNKCYACVSITNGSNIDVLEIDAASNRGIDEIRDLREKIKFAPSNLPKKIYIIDEVHMLTIDAFNALLKTLEEPPDHAIFILCTTEGEKIPGTIASRTFHVIFKKPAREEIARSLARMVAGEHLSIQEDVISDICDLSDGSFRDAAKTLEELAFLAKEEKITRQVLEKIHNVQAVDAAARNLLAYFSDKKLNESLLLLEDLYKRGVDLRILVEKMVGLLHNILLSRAGIIEADTKISFQDAEIKNLIESLNQCYKDIKGSVLPQLPLEILAIEWCLPPAAGMRDEKSEMKDEKLQNGSKTEEKTKGGLDNFAERLTEAVKRDNHSIAGILRGCTFIGIKDDLVELRTTYKFHKDKLSQVQTKAVLDRRASELLARDVHVIVNLVEK